MTSDPYEQDPLCRVAIAALAAQFSGRVSGKVVARTVLAARHDLEGQIQPDALAEMLHRLAQYRLDAMISART